MTEREALKQALEPTKEMIDAAERIDWSDSDVRGNIVNMWQAMCAAQPKQKHVAVRYKYKFKDIGETGAYEYHSYDFACLAHMPKGEPLYLAPPQRKWVGLTADELNMIGDRMRTWNSHSLADVYVAIEAKLKEKNA